MSYLKQLNFEQVGPTEIYIDNLSALRIINDNRSPTDRVRHMNLRFFAIQDWREDGDIIMKHIPGIYCMPDALTKNLGWVLNSRHCRRMMGHYNYTNPVPALRGCVIIVIIVIRNPHFRFPRTEYLACK